MTPLILTLPMPETLTNSGAGRSRNHWSISKRRKQYGAYLDELQLVGRIPPPPATPIGRARIATVMHLGGRMDVDNAMARHKWPIDWLATRGYLVNDRLLEWDRMPVQIVKRDGNYTIVITLTPLD